MEMDPPFSVQGKETIIWNDDDLLAPDDSSNSTADLSSDKERFLILSEGEDELLEDDKTDNDNVENEIADKMMNGNASLGTNDETKMSATRSQNSPSEGNDEFVSKTSKKGSVETEKATMSESGSDCLKNSLKSSENKGKRPYSATSEDENDYESKSKLMKSVEEENGNNDELASEIASDINSKGKCLEGGQLDKSTEGNGCVVEKDMQTDSSSHSSCKNNSTTNDKAQLSKNENDAEFELSGCKLPSTTLSGNRSALIPLTEELFEDESLEQFALSPTTKESILKSEDLDSKLSNKSDSCGTVNIDNIISSLSSPNAGSTDKNNGENEESIADIDTVVEDKKSSNVRLSDCENIANDRVEVKKVKLDLVFGEKAVDKDGVDKDNCLISETSSSENTRSIDNDSSVKVLESDNAEKIDFVETKNSTEAVNELQKNEMELDEKKCINGNTNGSKIDAETNGEIKRGEDEEKAVMEEKKYMSIPELEETVIKNVCDMIYEEHNKTVISLLKRIENMEKAAEKAKRRLAYYQTMVSNLTFEHRKQLAKLGHLPKAHTRTVGVNVRILQEYELQSPPRMRASKENFSPSVTATNPVNCTPLNTNMQLAQATAKKCILPRVPSNVLSGPRLPTPNVSTPTTFTAVTSQLIANATPGVTSAAATFSNKPRLQPAILGRQSTPKPQINTPSSTPIVLISTSNAVTTSSSINVIDLTEDGDNTTTTTTSVPTSQSSAMMISPAVSKSITGSATNLVPVPLVSSLPSVVQLIPSGSQANPVLSGGNTLRVARPSAMLSQNLPQGSRVTYLVPQNSGTLTMVPRLDPPVTQIGNLSAHQPPFVTSSGQLQTILLRMPPTVPVSAVSAAHPVLSSPKPVVSQAPQLPPGNQSSSTTLISCVTKHPAPLPAAPLYSDSKGTKLIPPKPALKISKVSNDIVLMWDMCRCNTHADIATYQLFAYQESSGTVNSSLWEKVGDVQALRLPMACTLTRFVEGHKYHFAVRAVDSQKRIGPFSDPLSVVLLPCGRRISK